MSIMFCERAAVNTVIVANNLKDVLVEANWAGSKPCRKSEKSENLGSNIASRKRLMKTDSDFSENRRA
jgi:hypothetical protein